MSYPVYRLQTTHRFKLVDVVPSQLIGLFPGRQHIARPGVDLSIPLLHLVDCLPTPRSPLVEGEHWLAMNGKYVIVPD